jgi:hypothetical protein
MVARPEKALPKGMPDCLKKRRLLNDKALSQHTCRELGEKFEAQGFLEDALEFYRRGNYEAGLERLKAEALETGDAYLMARLGPHPPEVWRQVADRALKLEKIRFARRALEQAGDREAAEDLAQRFEGDGS